MVAYAIQSPAPPFPVFALAYVINGFGLSLQDAQANGYISNYHTNTATLMGIMHGVYGQCTYLDSFDIRRLHSVRDVQDLAHYAPRSSPLSSRSKDTGPSTTCAPLASD